MKLCNGRSTETLFSAVGNAAKRNVKQGDSLAEAVPVTLDVMMGPVKQMVTRDQRAKLMFDDRSDPLSNSG